MSMVPPIVLLHSAKTGRGSGGPGRPPKWPIVTGVLVYAAGMTALILWGDNLHPALVALTILGLSILAAFVLAEIIWRSW
ncbi:hypothetical protein ACQP2Y_21730 [Actinoplanes sp. CA-051413]|uniref:hypothetical protein n=1 Tax=Actinoplanes sp. CA-051413 TaxID=3239899 RepID=UPI003D9647B2